MTGIENIELLVLAPNQAHDGLSLRHGTDMIFFSGDIEDRTGNIREVYSLPPQHNLTLYQLILLIKLANPLSECCAGERYAIIYPLIHGQPRVHRLIVHNAIPHGHIRSDIVGNGPYHTVACIDEFTGHNSVNLCQQIWIKILLVGEHSIKSYMLSCEVDGRGEQYQVLQVFTGEECRIHGTHRAP